MQVSLLTSLGDPPRGPTLLWPLPRHPRPTTEHYEPLGGTGVSPSDEDGGADSQGVVAVAFVARHADA